MGDIDQDSSKVDQKKIKKKTDKKSEKMVI
jgi:hypothetical protein